MELFVVALPNAVMCGEETNVKVAGKMTCKLNFLDMTSPENPLYHRILNVFRILCSVRTILRNLLNVLSITV